MRKVAPRLHFEQGLLDSFSRLKTRSTARCTASDRARITARLCLGTLILRILHCGAREL